MKETSKIEMLKLLNQFSNIYTESEMPHFHTQWQQFLKTLSEKERKIATKSLLATILDNTKILGQDLLKFAQEGDKERQTALDMMNQLAAHPAFAAKHLTAN